MCIPDGCYDFDVNGPPPISEYQSYEKWIMCGVRGMVPYHSKLCVEKDYNLCYGLEHCPYEKSYAHTSDGNFYVLSALEEVPIGGGGGGGYYYYSSEAVTNTEKFDEENVETELIPILVDISNVHGVNTLCGMEDGCYKLDVGAGQYTDTDRNTFEICGVTSTFPMSGTVCVENNGTTCELKDVALDTCSANHRAHKFIKIDLYGDGWEGSNYVIRKRSNRHIAFEGTLDNGQIEVDSLCLEIDTCYTLDVGGQSFYDNEILFQMCGLLGGAPIRDVDFCVTADGCQFQNIDDDVYNSIYDDDFPTNDDTRSQRHRPTPHPIAPPSSSTSGNAAYVYTTNLTLTVQIKVTYSGVHDSDMSFVGYALKHVLINQGTEYFNDCVYLYMSCMLTILYFRIP